MKDSQPRLERQHLRLKYIKANNERFSTECFFSGCLGLSISRRIMKDSQPMNPVETKRAKYIKANNERFSTQTKTLDAPR